MECSNEALTCSVSIYKLLFTFFFFKSAFRLQIFTFFMCSEGTFTLTVGKHIVVNRGGRQESAELSLGVGLLQGGPLPAAVNPCSPPHCRRRALHRFTPHTAGTRQRFKANISNCLVSNNKAIISFYTQILQSF